MSPPTLSVSLVPAGRQLTFSPAPGGIVDICRRVGGAAAAWEVVAQHATASFLDTKLLPAGAGVEYYVLQLGLPGLEERRSNVVRLILP